MFFAVAILIVVSTALYLYLNRNGVLLNHMNKKFDALIDTLPNNNSKTLVEQGYSRMLYAFNIDDERALKLPAPTTTLCVHCSKVLTGITLTKHVTKNFIKSCLRRCCIYRGAQGNPREIEFRKKEQYSLNDYLVRYPYWICWFPVHVKIITEPNRIDELDYAKESPLHKASVTSVALTRTMLKYQANTSLRNSQGLTPLSYALIHVDHQLSTLEMFLNERPGCVQTDATVVPATFFRCDWVVLKRLLEHFASLNMVNGCPCLSNLQHFQTCLLLGAAGVNNTCTKISDDKKLELRYMLYFRTSFVRRLLYEMKELPLPSWDY